MVVLPRRVIMGLGGAGNLGGFLVLRAGCARWTERLLTAGEYHCIDVRFQDKTVMHFVIEPYFTLEPEYSDWKTGNLRRIKRWPPIRSQPLNS
jgi:hypothetical protein